MENLIDLINNEFERAGYFSSDGFLWKHHKYKDFWVVCMVGEGYVLSELQNKIVEGLTDERSREPEMEKNTSLLIIHEVEDSSENVERVISEENDVYVFKKYVLQYTAAEWNCVKSLYADGSIALSDILMRKDIFEKLRDNRNCPEALLYRIAHKLPFATISVSKKEYEFSDSLLMPGALGSIMEWMDAVPSWEGKTPSEQDLNTMKDKVRRKIESIIRDGHED